MATPKRQYCVNELGLRSSIEQAIDDQARWDIYADWLQDQGRFADSFTIRTNYHRVIRGIRKLPVLPPHRCQKIQTTDAKTFIIDPKTGKRKKVWASDTGVEAKMIYRRCKKRTYGKETICPQCQEEEEIRKATGYSWCYLD